MSRNRFGPMQTLGVKRHEAEGVVAPTVRSRSRTRRRSSAQRRRRGRRPGHIIGIRDRTQMRSSRGRRAPWICGAFPAAHRRPRAQARPGRYEKVCIGHDTSRAWFGLRKPLGEPVRASGRSAARRLPGRRDRADAQARDGYFAMSRRGPLRRRRSRDRGGGLGGADAECLWKFRVKDFGPLTVGYGSRQLAHHESRRCQEKLKELYAV